MRGSLLIASYHDFGSVIVREISATGHSSDWLRSDFMASGYSFLSADW